jgi:predicted glycoside hydrolase/deacetylase ChbG (UPF0249 family)
MNAEVNAGVVTAFSRGLLTSTSLLANAPAAAQAVTLWNDLSRRRARATLPSLAGRATLGDWGLPFDLGVHLNLTQGRPITGKRFPEVLLGAEGSFLNPFRLLARLRRHWPIVRSAVRAELAAQIEWLIDHGHQPTHLNGHQYVEMMPGVAGLIVELLDRYQIPTVRVACEPGLVRTTLLHRPRPAAWLLAVVKRHFAVRFREQLTGTAARHPDAYFGTAHAGRIDLSLVDSYLRCCPRDGWIEVGMHPAAPLAAEPWAAHDPLWHDPLAELRPAELQLLTSGALVELPKRHGAQLARLAPTAAEFAPHIHRRANVA